MTSSAPYGLPIISLCLALVAMFLRRVHGLGYWIVPLCVFGLSMAAMPWMPEGDKLVCIVAFALPTSLVFAVADTNALRVRPWLIVLVVPPMFLAAVFFGLVAGESTGVLRP